MTVAADLKTVKLGLAPPEVQVGSETARVCQKAARISSELGIPMYATAGLAPKYGVIMGNGPMREYFLNVLRLPAGLIRTPIANVFRTNGQMIALVEELVERIRQTGDTYDIYLVARWWHLPRAALLLQTRINETAYRDHMRIKRVRVWTFHDPRMIGELIAWIKNARNFKSA